MGWFNRWLQERRRRRHEAEWERQAKAREEKLKTFDLSKYGVHQTSMGMWSAKGVTKLFMHPEDALLAVGWCALFDIGGTVFFEPWSGGLDEEIKARAQGGDLDVYTSGRN